MNRKISFPCFLSSIQLLADIPHLNFPMRIHLLKLIAYFALIVLHRCICTLTYANTTIESVFVLYMCSLRADLSTNKSGSSLIWG